jgi:hypothetical protein
MHQSAASSEMSCDHNRSTSKNDETQSTVGQLKYDDDNAIESDNANLSHALHFPDAQRDLAAYASNAELSQGMDARFADLQHLLAVPLNCGQCDDESSHQFSFSDCIGFLHKDEGERDNDKIDDDDDTDSICDSIRVTIRRRLKESNRLSSDQEYM